MDSLINSETIPRLKYLKISNVKCFGDKELKTLSLKNKKKN